MQEEYALKMSGITKKFPGVLALDHVSLRVRKGEVHALLGENGAGKSTLMKILSGAYTKDEGEIELFGEKVELGNPAVSKKLGIGIIYQELNLVPTLTVAENIFIGRYPRKNRFQIDWRSMQEQAEKILRDLEVEVHATDITGKLGIAQQQMIEIAKAVSLDARIIIMDEPTAPLTDRETRRLFGIVEKLKSQGISVIYISHRLEEVKEICSRATIMRDGQTITEIDVAKTQIDEIIRHMVGRELTDQYPQVEKEIGDVIFEVKGLTIPGKVSDINFQIRAGEVLGIAGLVGAGRTETARGIFGLDAVSSGKIYVDGKECTIKKPGDAIAAGIGFVTEDRKDQGLVLCLSVGENITLASLDEVETAGVLSLGKEQKIIQSYVDKMNIKTPSSRQRVENLSGGNQQKVVLAKWMLSNCKVLIFDEPTRGIDVGAKVEVYNIINALAKEGKAVMMISSEIAEVIGVSDRVMVMARGKVQGSLDSTDITQEKIMTLAIGMEDERGDKENG